MTPSLDALFSRLRRSQSTSGTSAGVSGLPPDAVHWGYRLVLDREPESAAVVQGLLASITDTSDLRHSLLTSDEFRSKNPNHWALSGESECNVFDLIATSGRWAQLALTSFRACPR